MKNRTSYRSPAGRGVRRNVFIATVFASTTVGAASTDGFDPRIDAASRIVRFEPTRSKRLPRAYAVDLARRGCTIPQSVIANQPLEGIDNVISGSFARRGQKDFAVVCSRDGVSHVDISWGGKARCASELDLGRDIDALAESGNDNALGYSQGIDRASQKTIAHYRRGLGGPAAPDRSHDGIEVSDSKASTISYCANGKWVKLQGMD